MEDPIFTIKTEETNKEYKIYLDGMVEGFGEKVHIVNRIPSTISTEVAHTEHDILLSMAKALSKLIKDYCWSTETFYSNTESKSLHSDSEQANILYRGLATILSPSLSEEK